MKKMLFLVLFGLLTCFACHQSESLWKGSIEVVDGVTIVKNPGKPMFGPEKCQLKEILTIGNEEGDENKMFWGSLTVRTDDKLNIYISDMMARRLSKFDAKGNFLWATGRQGQGPGEFEAIWDFTIDNRNQEILVLDNNQIDVFSLDGGRYLRSMNLKQRNRNIDILKSGDLLILPHAAGAYPLIYDAEGRFVREFAPLYSFGPPGLPSGGFAPERAYQAFGERVFFSLPDTYEIREYDLSGAVQRVITKDQKLVTFNIRRQNGVISSISVRDWSGPCFVWGDGYLINRIMARSDESATRDWFLDFFDPDGRYICSCPLPESDKLDHVDRAGHLYFVHRLPFPKIVKYQFGINEFFP